MRKSEEKESARKGREQKESGEGREEREEIERDRKRDRGGVLRVSERQEGAEGRE